jgi:hypothetical protein
MGWGRRSSKAANGLLSSQPSAVRDLAQTIPHVVRSTLLELNDKMVNKDAHAI